MNKINEKDGKDGWSNWREKEKLNIKDLTLKMNEFVASKGWYVVIHNKFTFDINIKLGMMKAVHDHKHRKI